MPWALQIHKFEGGEVVPMVKAYWPSKPEDYEAISRYMDFLVKYPGRHVKKDRRTLVRLSERVPKPKITRNSSRYEIVA